MESSVRGENDDPTKGVDSFLDGANLSCIDFEPSLQATQPSESIDSPSLPPVQKFADPQPVETPLESEIRTPPLTVADLAAPPQKPQPPDDDVDNSPLARQAAQRQPAVIARKRPSSHRALSFRLTDDDKLDVPEAILKKLEESDNEESAGENTKAMEGEDTIGSLPFPPTQRRPSKSLSSFRSVSPSKASMFQTPAAIRSTMNRLPTETAISQRIRDVEVPPSVMKELESDKRLLGLNERNDKSGVLTLREQGAVIDKLRKENFGLKIKVFYLEGKINQQYDEASRDVMKENIELTRALKELTRTIAGYKRTITDLEKRLAEAEAKQQCNRRHLEDDEVDNSTLLERANMKEQLSAYESELDMLRRRDLERESELSRLRDLVRSISNGNVADEALSEYLDKERSRKEDLEHENRELREQLRRGVSTARTSVGDEAETVTALKKEIEDLRKESVAQTQVLSARNREREQLYAELEELKLQHMRNSRTSTTAMNGDSGHEECEATINELRDRLTEMRMQNQDQRDELDGALRDLEQLDQEKLDAHEDYQVEIDRLQEIIDQLVEKCDELREAKDEAERAADELDQEIDALVKEAQEKMAYQEREIRIRDEDLVAMKTDMQEALDKAYVDIESLEETVMNKNARIENLRDQLQDIEEEHAKLIQKYEDNVQQGSRLQVQQEVSARELQFLREEADNSALKVADFQNLEKKCLEAERKYAREAARVKELLAKVDVLESDKGIADSEAEEKLKKQVEELTEELNNSKQELWQLTRKSGAKDMDTKAMEKEINEGKRICVGVIGSDLDESLPLRKAGHMIRRLVEELERAQLEVQELQHDIREEKKKHKDFQNLLEEMGTKTKQQKDGLDKERLARKAAIAQVNNLEASNKSMRQTLSEWESRITEMQKTRESEQRTLRQMEVQFKEQLTERNSLLATLWQRLGAIVGSKWVDKMNAQGGGGDVAPNTNFVGFSRNILHCAKVLEDVMVNFKLKCKSVERELLNEYKNIDAMLENRTKRIIRLETLVRDSGKGDIELKAELAKLKTENRSLKSEYNELLSKSRARVLRDRDTRETPSPSQRSPITKANAAATSTTAASPQAAPGNPSIDKRWLLRFQELESRLKSEQEGRALDQKGAKIRLEEVRRENAELRNEIKEKGATSAGQSSGSTKLSKDEGQEGNVG